MFRAEKHTGGSAAFIPLEKDSRTGFSLVELLVVIGIVGLLGSTFFGVFGSARKSGRDSRRVADLLQVEQALRVYYGKCGMYPGSFDGASNECIGGEISDAPGVNPTSWDELETTLKAAKIGIGSLPRDPVPGKEYQYFVQLRAPGETPRAQCYVLKTVLEQDNKVLANDLDNIEIESQLLPKTCADVSCKNFAFFHSLDCDDTPGSLNYCVGNLECFYGN